MADSDDPDPYLPERDAEAAPPQPPSPDDEEQPSAALAALESFVQHLVLAHVGPEVGLLARRRCPCCGLRFMEFRRTGRLGCPYDYEVYQAELIERIAARQGASRHVGKRPRRAWNGFGADLGQSRARERLAVRADQRAAVVREDYETASKLRDRLRSDPALCLTPAGPVASAPALLPVPSSAPRPDAGGGDQDDSSPALPDPSR